MTFQCMGIIQSWHQHPGRHKHQRLSPISTTTCGGLKVFRRSSLFTKAEGSQCAVDQHSRNFLPSLTRRATAHTLVHSLMWQLWSTLVVYPHRLSRVQPFYASSTLSTNDSQLLDYWKLPFGRSDEIEKASGGRARDLSIFR
ncbi:hypothetical protein JAAARDRAFT_440938 [Jaapia argillacea MUCL 33604]|uniref:Uncharacterized protein n=1 Tax=Jaapia argillacea MUCL 33604 TaxID=933084 RepID=A0A067PE09_9AGAM|nr:hypothetical protein JAAARDRAFT_440938 [Jaapia argillacea MUCL 33604]